VSLYCDIDDAPRGADWWWYQPADEAPLTTKRSRRCCSCSKMIRVGELARKVQRYRALTEFEEMRGIACDEVPLSDWYLCEPCGDLADSIAELGFCYTLGGASLKEQIAEYRRAEDGVRRRLAAHRSLP